MVSLTGASDLHYSVQQIKSDILYSLLAYLAAFSVVRNWQSFRLVQLTGIVTLFGLSAVAISSYSIHGDWLIGYQNSRGFFTTSIVSLVPLCLSVYLPGELRGTTAERVFAGVAFAVAAIACYLAGSRVTWPILLLTPLVYWMHASERNWPRNWPRRALVILAVCACTIFLLSLAAQRAGKEVSFIDDRVSIYQTAIKEIGRNLLTGTGFGRESNRNAYGVALEKDRSIRHSHSLLLSYPEQMGILGALTVIVMFWSLLRAFLKDFRRSALHEKMLGLIGINLTMAVFLKSTTDMFFTGHNLVLFWAQCGVMLGLAAHLRCPRETARQLRS